MKDLTFDAERPRLLAIAYRMLGSASDAEDVVQEAWLRWHHRSGAPPERPGAWLGTVVTRLCIDFLKSARSRRERYVGPWLPEPLLTESPLEAAPADPDQSLSLADSLSTAFLLVLEQLTPQERAVFLLREVFDYPYDAIAEVVDKSEANCRQIATRARRSIQADRSRFEVDREQHRLLLERFLAAATTGDVDGFASLLADDVAFWADGGGKDPGRGGVHAVRRPIVGRAAVAQLMGAVVSHRGPVLEATIHPINGSPGAAIYFEGALHAVLTLGVRDGAIAELFFVSNPDKLAALERQLPALGASLQSQCPDGSNET